MTQARMTRLEFDNGLRMVREPRVAMTGTVTEALQATTALLDQNLEAVRATASLERELKEDPLLVEQYTLQLIARERPVASELWMLLSAIKISAECWRIGLLAHHIGMPARHFARLRPFPMSYWRSFAGWRMSRAKSLTMPAPPCWPATHWPQRVLRSTTPRWIACVVHFSGRC